MGTHFVLTARNKNYNTPFKFVTVDIQNNVNFYPEYSENRSFD